MRMTVVTLAVCLTSLLLPGAASPGVATGAFVTQTQPGRGQAQPGQTEFVPLKELPPDEQLPAARLLISAYAFVWVVLLAYLWSIWRRLAKVERELAEVARRTSSQGRA